VSKREMNLHISMLDDSYVTCYAEGMKQEGSTFHNFSRQRHIEEYCFFTMKMKNSSRCY
jgi:hypothetical protein